MLSSQNDANNKKKLLCLRCLPSGHFLKRKVFKVRQPPPSSPAKKLRWRPVPHVKHGFTLSLPKLPVEEHHRVFNRGQFLAQWGRAPSAAALRALPESPELTKALTLPHRLVVGFWPPENIEKVNQVKCLFHVNAGETFKSLRMSIA